MKLNPYKTKAEYVSVCGIMLALACGFTALESIFSAFLPAGMRIGLANIVTMAVCAAVNLPSALIITVLKSVFVLLTRGVTAGAMSLCGGLPAFAVMGLLFAKTRASYLAVSVSSAAVHSAGQLVMASLLTGSGYTLYYAPVLMAVSVGSGICTGLALGVIMPHLEKMLRKHCSG